MLIMDGEDKYIVIDKFSTIRSYHKDNNGELLELCQTLHDAYLQLEDKYRTNFKKYWSMKKQLNKITDIIGEYENDKVL